MYGRRQQTRLSEADALEPVTRTYRRGRSGLAPAVDTTCSFPSTMNRNSVSKQVGSSLISAASFEL